MLDRRGSTKLTVIEVGYAVAQDLGLLKLLDVVVGDVLQSDGFLGKVIYRPARLDKATGLVTGWHGYCRVGSSIG